MPISSKDFENKTVTELVELIRDEGLTLADSSYLIGNFILEQAGRGQRTFRYADAFAAEDPACASDFARGFAHRDWIDGESVVQAEETSVEEGFNRRFHALETDLDALGANLARAFACVADMRAELHARLEEIRTELNRLNGDVFECCTDTSPPRPTFPTFPVFPGTIVDELRTPLGTTRFDDRDYFVYKIDDKLEFFPVVTAPETIRPFDVVSDPAVRGPGEVARMLADNAEIAAFVRNERPGREELTERFGDVVTPGGVRFGELIRTLPADARYNEPEALIDDLAERSAAALRLSNRGDMVAASFGVGRDVGLVAEAPVERLPAVPARASEALRDKGFSTVEKFAGADRDEVIGVLRDAGISVGEGEVAGWMATAKTLGRLR